MDEGVVAGALIRRKSASAVVSLRSTVPTMRSVLLVVGFSLVGCASAGPAFQKPDMDAVLDARIAAEEQGDAAAVASRDAALKQRFAPTAVFISDMSGFTKLTREKGLAWFLSQIRRMERIALPLLTKHGVELVKQYGDDLFVVSSDPAKLHAFARDFLADIATEAARPGGAQLRVSGGIAFGDVLRVGNDLFGDPVNRSSKLGEDLAEPGELLLAEEVFAALPKEQTADCVLQPAGSRNAAFGFYLCGATAR